MTNKDILEIKELANKITPDQWNKFKDICLVKSLLDIFRGK